VLHLRQLRRLHRPDRPPGLARGATVILGETDSNDSRDPEEIPKEWQPMPVTASVE
jgi:hypothetical protein